ncbi:hypothetical protein MmiHf6_17170 [Methanimicrococcus hongohii]|uniref:Uncharacterized protein n=1 Tax=Methanimicrococcus hongohii TaxID=3028295 RepID=A0AA96V0X9_9EURY|nr:hypothetical protein MmiHf6_17170 [Methanimicrococcus sp. Hf6]
MNGRFYFESNQYAELAEYLVSLEKYIIQNGKKAEIFSLNIEYPMNFQLYLFSPDDSGQNFTVNVKESEKNL